MADIFGTNDDDIIDEEPFDGVSSNTNNTFHGLEGDDTIVAGPAEQPPFDGNGAGPQDNDVIVGGLGNDTMTGGYGNDKFVFTFTVEEQATEYNFLDFEFVPNTNANINAWESTYENWIAFLNSLGTVDFGDPATTTVTVGNKNPQDFTDDFTASVVELTVEGEGYDEILDFGNDKGGDGDDGDQLILLGLSADAEAANYWDAVLDSHQVTEDDVTSTIITFDGGSITLVGVQTTIEDMVLAGKVVFDLA
jgi:hypothetical protein